MVPNPDSEGPVDGEEVQLKILPHHQKAEAKKSGGGPKLLKLALTGTAVIGGIVGLWWLYKRFFSGKKKAAAKKTNGTTGEGGGKLRRREVIVDEFGDELQGAFEEALDDEGFLEFLLELEEAGVLEAEE